MCKVKDGEMVDDLFGFLICFLNVEVKVVYEKVMLVILIDLVDWEMWMGSLIEFVIGL